MADAQKPVVVHLDRISKSFGNTVAVRDLDMRILAGEFVTFLGPSGCGKSTTLRMLGGFERPDRGRIILSGEDVTDLPPNRRKVNMVFQDYALFPHMNVRRNIAFGLELKGLTRPQIDARLDELLSFLELEAFRERRPDQLSGGQRQRVALARALAPDPDLLLLDEPLGALDAKLRTQVQHELKSIQRRTGKTFFFVTHDQDEAMIMSDRIVVMNRGLVEQEGTPEDLYFRPRSRFVAEFLGETNLLEGHVRGAGDGVVSFDWRGVPLRGHSTGDTPGIGETASAALRLEKLVLAADRPATDNAVQGRITSRTFKGSRTTVELTVAAAQGAVLKSYVDTDAAQRFGEAPVWIGWDLADMAILRD